MAETIKDGTGFGFEVKVDSTNRMYTDSVIRDEVYEYLTQGELYNLSTGVINLTSANQSAVFYLKNNDTEGKILVIKEILVIPATSTGGTGAFTIQVIKNPTTGTLIDNALAGTQSNRNFGSANTITGDIYKGAEGYTLTDGSVFATTSRSTIENVAFDAAPIALNKSNSIGLKFTPQSGNTSQNVIIAATVYMK